MKTAMQRVPCSRMHGRCSWAVRAWMTSHGGTAVPKALRSFLGAGEGPPSTVLWPPSGYLSFQMPLLPRACLLPCLNRTSHAHVVYLVLTCPCFLPYSHMPMLSASCPDALVAMPPSHIPLPPRLISHVPVCWYHNTHVKPDT